MAGLLTKLSLAIKFYDSNSNKEIQYFPCWSSPEFFPEKLSFCVYYNGRTLYIPCVNADVFSKYGGQIKFYHGGTLYYFLSQDVEPGNSENSGVSFTGYENNSNDEYNWTKLVVHISCSEIYGRQRLGMLYKLRITVLENNTDTIQDCNLTTNSIANQLTGLLSYVNYENNISRGYHYYVHTANYTANSKKDTWIEVTYNKMRYILDYPSTSEMYKEFTKDLTYYTSSGNETVHYQKHYTIVTIDDEDYYCDYAKSEYIEPPSKLSDTIRITLDGTDFQQDYTINYDSDEGFHYPFGLEGVKIQLLEN